MAARTRAVAFSAGGDGGGRSPTPTNVVAWHPAHGCSGHRWDYPGDCGNGPQCFAEALVKKLLLSGVAALSVLASAAHAQKENMPRPTHPLPSYPKAVLLAALGCSSAEADTG